MKSEYVRLAATLNPRLIARAIKIADEHVLSALSSSCGLSTKGGWRICHEYDDDEEYLVYAAERGLIERDPERAARYRVTKAGLALLPNDGPSSD